MPNISTYIDPDVLLSFLLLTCYISIFLLGWIIGKKSGVKYNNILLSNDSVGSKNIKNHQNIIEKMQKVTIDDSKFIANIDTSDMEKKYDNIANSIEINDNIDQSVDKLSSLIKGK
jgi:ABC-type tungstate transport system permease subunit